MMTRATTGHIPTLDLRHRLRLAREHAGLEQTQLHAKTGISRATISASENGKTRPHDSTVRAWAAATGVDYWWILAGDDSSPSGCADGPLSAGLMFSAA